MIIISNEFKPTGTIDGTPICLTSEGAITHSGATVAQYIDDPKWKPNPTLPEQVAPKILNNANGKTPEIKPIKQIGGVGLSDDLDITNWAIEISSGGRVAIIRNTHGEIWA